MEIMNDLPRRRRFKDATARDDNLSITIFQSQRLSHLFKRILSITEMKYFQYFLRLYYDAVMFTIGWIRVYLLDQAM